MSYRSSISSSRKALALAAVLLLAAWIGIGLSPLPPVAFFGGERLAQKVVALRAFERERPIDAFVIGASHVDVIFDTDRFEELSGLHTLNMGVESTDAYFQSLLVRRLLEDGQRPRLVLWALLNETLTGSKANAQYLRSPALRGGDGALGFLGLERGFWVPRFQRRNARQWVRALGAILQPVDDRQAFLLAGPAQSERPGAGGASTGLQEAPDPARMAGNRRPVELAIAHAHIQETLERLLALGTEVWFFRTPFAAAAFERDGRYARELLTGLGTDDERWLQDLARSHDVPLISLRYCDEISPREEYFRDLGHLNLRGGAVLAELMDEIVSGRRALPEAWQGAPARAEVEAVLGRIDPAAVARFPVAERHALGAAVVVRDETRQPPLALSLVADVRIERRGRYRAVLIDDAPREHTGSFFVRLGDGPFEEREAPAASAEPAVVVEAELGPGVQRFELHTRHAPAGLDWDAWAIEPIPR